MDGYGGKYGKFFGFKILRGWFFLKAFQVTYDERKEDMQEIRVPKLFSKVVNEAHVAMATGCDRFKYVFYNRTLFEIYQIGVNREGGWEPVGLRFIRSFMDRYGTMESKRSIGDAVWALIALEGWNESFFQAIYNLMKTHSFRNTAV